MILFGLSGCATQYERGMRAINEQRWEDAKHQARQGMAQDIGAPEYHLLMAEALVGEAMALYAQEQSDGSSPPVELQKAQKRYREALPHAKKAFDSGEFDARAGRILGKVYYELNRPIDTALVWQRARQADPTIVSDEDYIVAIRTGLVEAVSLEDSERALTLREEFKRILEQKPEILEAQHPRDAAMFREAVSQEAFRRNRQNLARDKVKQREYAEAIELYAALAADYPEESIYHFELGRLYLQQGKEPEAIAAFEAYTRAPDPKQRLQRMRKVASRAEQVNVRSIAMLFYTKMLGELGDEPSDMRADILIKLARINLVIGDVAPAKEHLQNYLDDLHVMRGTKLLNAYIAKLRAARPHQLADIFYHAPRTLTDALSPALHPSVYTNISTTAIQHTQPDIAIEFLELAVVNARVDFGTTKRLGELYARKAQTGDVERVLKLYVERREGAQSAIREAARWSLQRLNYDLAQFFFEQLVQRGFAQAKDHEALARIYGQQGRIEELKRSLETYLELSNNSRNAMTKAARFYTGQRLYEEAEELLLEAQKKYPTAIDFPKELAKLYRDWDKPDKIDDAYEPWLKAKGRRAVDLVTVGNDLNRSHDQTKALPYFLEAAEKGERRAWMQAARIYSQRGRDADMKRAIDAYVDASVDRVSALTEALSYYNSPSHNDEAIRILEELVELQDNVPNGQVWRLADLYLEQGRERDAYDLCSDYLSRSRKPYAELKSIADFFDRRNRPEWVLELYQQLLDRGAVDAQIYRQLGDLLLDIGDKNPGRIGLTHHQTRDKALLYYTRYFEEVDVTGDKLRQFANKLKEKGFFELAERAYAKFIRESSRAQPNATFDHASMLLALDQTDRATALFERYYSLENKSPRAAMSIANALSKSTHYTLAEPYLLDALDSRDTKIIEQAFEKLSTIYHETDRAEEFSTLIKKFVSRTANPSSARQTIARAAEKYGRWEIAIEQHEELSRSRDAAGQQYIAIHLWRLGKRDESLKRWERWASAQTATKGLSYVQIAEFMDAHLEPELAMEFLDKAVSADPESYLVYLHRGRMRLLTADVELGKKDFSRALTKVEPGRREEVLRVYISTLQMIGQHQIARDVARDALKLQGINKAPLLLTIAADELSSQDDIRIDRIITELQQSGVQLESLIGALYGAQLYERAAALLEEEVASGDYVQAGEIMINNADIFTNIGGIDRLMRALQPLLDRHRDDRRLEAALGKLLIREGHLERGAIFLRTSVDAGHYHYRLMLAHANLQLGRDTEAHRLFFDELASIPAPQRPARVDDIAMRYLSAGKDAALDNLLDHMMRDERFVIAATPIFIRRVLVYEGVFSATNYVRGIIEDNPAMLGGRETSALTSRTENLQHEVSLLGVKEIIAHGYHAEARALLEAYPRHARDSSSYKDVKLLLDVIDPTRDHAASLEAKLGPLPEGSTTYSQAQATELLDTALHLVLANKPDEARALAEPYLTDPIIDNATAALKILTAHAYINKRPEQVIEIIDAFIDARSDKARARGIAFRLLTRLGMDDAGLALMEEGYKYDRSINATEQNLDRAFMFAPNSDFERYVERATRVLSNPRSKLTSLLDRNANNLSNPIPLEALEDVLRTNPNLASVQMSFALHDYWAGDVASARARWLGYLERIEYDHTAVEQLLATLATFKLDVEITGAILPSVPPAQLTPSSRMLVGVSFAALEREEEAKEQFDAYIKASQDTNIAANNIAELLSGRGLTELSGEYAEMAIRRDPTRPAPYYWRALARIKLGDTAGARADLERSLRSGQFRFGLLMEALEAALEADQLELATELSTDMIRFIPSAPNSQPPHGATSPLFDAITIWGESPRAKEGLAHIEAVVPSLFDTPYTNRELYTSLAGLYEQSGATEQSFELLGNGLDQAIARSRYANAINLNNNLAWTYAVADVRLDEAERLSRTSIALDNGRNAAYLDTLGWIYYRRGDNATALELIDKSLRLTTSLSNSRDPRISEHYELIDHTVTLQEKLGRREKSTWLKIVLEQGK